MIEFHVEQHLHFRIQSLHLVMASVDNQETFALYFLVSRIQRSGNTLSKDLSDANLVDDRLCLIPEHFLGDVHLFIMQPFAIGTVIVVKNLFGSLAFVPFCFRIIGDLAAALRISTPKKSTGEDAMISFESSTVGWALPKRRSYCLPMVKRNKQFVSALVFNSSNKKGS